MSHKLIISISLLCGALLLTGCGHKGALSLPAKESHHEFSGSRSQVAGNSLPVNFPARVKNS